MQINNLNIFQFIITIHLFIINVLASFEEVHPQRFKDDLIMKNHHNHTKDD